MFPFVNTTVYAGPFSVHHFGF